MNEQSSHPDVDKFGNKRTAYAILCHEHGLVYLSEEEYNYQMHYPNRSWLCPMCQGFAGWDEDNYEEMLEKER